MFKRIISGLLTVAITLTSVSTASLTAGAEDMTDATGSVTESEDRLPTPEGMSMTMNSVNSLGSMIADAAKSSGQLSKYNGTFGITNLVVQGQSAAVALFTGGDCELIVAIYTEDGEQMLMSKNSRVGDEDEAVGVIFDKALPDMI